MNGTTAPKLPPAASGLSATTNPCYPAQPSTISESSTRPANFDHLAGIYRWLEYLTFGPMLSRCRLHFLPRLGAAKKVLVLGDGDGRFVEQFLSVNCHATVDIVDSSGAMLKLVHRRVARIAGAGKQVRLVRRDAREFFPDRTSATGGSIEIGPLRPGPGSYDLVISHFFLDCFMTQEVEKLVRGIAPYLSNDVRWVVSEFAVPARGRGLRRFARVAGRFVIGGLYGVFGVLTGMRVRTLPDYAGAFVKSGFGLSEQRLRVCGLLTCELWCREDSFGSQSKGGCAGDLD